MATSIFGGPHDDDANHSDDSSLGHGNSGDHLQRKNRLGAKDGEDIARASHSTEFSQDEAEDDSSSDDDTRPRFQGKTEKYRKFIADELALAHSLEQLRSGDLSVHLFNAHVLKRRARRSSSGVEEQMAAKPAGKPGRGTRRRGGRWMPPPGWTAWPMPPDIVPEPGVRFGVREESDGNVAIRRGGLTYDQELKECLQALCLKSAKQQWVEAGGSVNGTLGIGADVNAASPSNNNGLVMMADDDKAHALLDPVVQSTVAQLDRLLKRAYHITTGIPDEDDDREMKKARVKAARARQERARRQRVASGIVTGPRTGGRPAMYLRKDGESYYHMHKRLALAKMQPNAPTGVMDAGVSNSNVDTDADERPTVPPARKKVLYSSSKLTTKRLPGETYDRMYKRLSMGMKAEDESEVEEQLHQYDIRVKPVNNLDWVQVLDMAEHVGWDAKVVKRARERCAALFEGALEQMPPYTGPGQDEEELLDDHDDDAAMDSEGGGSVARRISLSSMSSGGLWVPEE